MSNLPIGLQLYSVRDQAAADFKDTVKRIADYGYQGVELAGETGGMGPEELKDFLGTLGIEAVSSHNGIEQIINDLDSLIDFAKKLGNKFVVCPWLGEDFRGKDGYVKVAKVLEEAGKKMADNGISLLYHNHSFEFEQFDGEYGLDILYANADPKYLQAELDVYWVKHGGADPVSYMKKYSGRTPLIHLKDMANDEERSMTEIGTGTVDIKGVCAAAAEVGTQWIIVEQDTWKIDPMDSMRISAENMKKMGLLS